ncbi:MAG: gamma-carboxylase, partial [Thermoleophilaceae bacterium]|nr:gamma-carboxylase [Thermoleophilaceae bacterium]
MTRVTRAWTHFWFAPQPTSTLALFRIAFGLLALVWTLLLAPDLFAFFSRDGLVPRQPDYLFELPWIWGVLGGAPGDPVVAVLFAVLLVACVCVLIGYRTRLASAAVFVGIVSFERRNPFVFNAGDALIRVMALYLVLA